MNSSAATAAATSAAQSPVRALRRVPLRLLTSDAATSRLPTLLVGGGDSTAAVWVPPGLRSDRAALLRRRLLNQRQPLPLVGPPAARSARLQRCDGQWCILKAIRNKFGNHLSDAEFVELEHRAHSATRNYPALVITRNYPVTSATTLALHARTPFRMEELPLTQPPTQGLANGSISPPPSPPATMSSSAAAALYVRGLGDQSDGPTPADSEPRPSASPTNAVC
jgi:hypothetical protein